MSWSWHYSVVRNYYERIHESPEANLGQETQTRLARGQPRAEHAVTTRGHPRARDAVPARQRPTSDKQRNSDSPDSISGDAPEGGQLHLPTLQGG